MRIAVDAMGGDYAPKVVIEGALDAVREFGAEIILVGNQEIIEKELSQYPAVESGKISIKHASETIGMNESPSFALRKKKDSSIKVAIEAVRDGTAVAMVSAGNTGAVLAAATLILRPLKGVDRPAIAAILPTKTGRSIVLDVGANVDCKSVQLFQFAIMGYEYAKYMLGKERPTVGLLSIGEEDTKGNEVTKEAFQLLKKSSINFIGNVEGKEVYRGNADVIVCDGFMGNIALKISESLAELIGNTLKKLFTGTLRGKLAYSLISPELLAFKKSFDYHEYGGAPLLGINGICIISHGSSSAKAIKNAIFLAQEFKKKEINLHIQEDIEANLSITPMPKS